MLFEDGNKTCKEQCHQHTGKCGNFLQQSNVILLCIKFNKVCFDCDKTSEEQVFCFFSPVDPCAADPVVGPCKGTFPRWYFDQNTGEWKHFLYSGCQGNHNNFLQELDCISECIQRSKSPLCFRFSASSVRNAHGFMTNVFN
uniref:BPTI/Kunitz inhibitor domain-containing protein n=1 Tax=Oryzias sinensis TaxID=183150 RepID=A0A8C7Z4S3_9TELE